MTKLILSHNVAGEEVQNGVAAVIPVPFKKGSDSPRLPRFVQSCLPPSDKEEQKQKPLTDAQVRRALKWYESICRIESLIAATDVKKFIVENGSMIGSYLLGQLTRMFPLASITFHGFDEENWPLLKNVEHEDAEISIHVYHTSASKEDKKDVAVIPVFAERTKIILPNFVLDAVDPKRDVRPIDRRKALTIYKYFVFVKVLEELGAKSILINNCAGLEPELVEALAREFKRKEYLNFPEDFFGPKEEQAAPSIEKLVALKEKFGKNATA
jgi:hypothetical protein